MSFDSLQYLLFLPLTVGLYRLTPGKWRWIPLLAASLYFYMQWNAAMGLVMLLVALVSWGAALGVYHAKAQWPKRLLLAADMVICLGVLVYFKYFTFLMESVNGFLAAVGVGGRLPVWEVLLPVGVSFFTFQAMSGVVDVYRGEMQPERHPGYFALYVTFFPQLVAGPIERANALLPQLRAHPNPTAEDTRMGLRWLLSGFFRKIVIADFAAPFVERVYALVNPDGSAVALGTLLFALQIYCDFAGYSEIAAGSARLMGVRLMRNFDRPYGAASIRAFWRRWHISLSSWFTDYVYIPLGGSRRGKGRQIAATMVVFALSGLWHGANWTFLVWGVLHGLLMTGDILLRDKVRGPKWLMTALTFLTVCVTWVFFRAQSLPQAADFLRALCSPWELGAGLSQIGLTGMDGLQMMLMLLLSPMLHGLTEEKRPVRGDVLALMAVAVLLAWGLRLENDVAGAFIYFQF